MKCNAFTMILLGALGVCAAISLLCCLQFAFVTREMHSIESEDFFQRNYRLTVQAVVNDCSEYARRHPDLNPILDPVLGNAAPAAPKLVK